MTFKAGALRMRTLAPLVVLLLEALAKASFAILRGLRVKFDLNSSTVAICAPLRTALRVWNSQKPLGASEISIASSLNLNVKLKDRQNLTSNVISTDTDTFFVMALKMLGARLGPYLPAWELRDLTANEISKAVKTR
jgi:hypothetical protein